MSKGPKISPTNVYPATKLDIFTFQRTILNFLGLWNHAQPKHSATKQIPWKKLLCFTFLLAAGLNAAYVVTKAIANIFTPSTPSTSSTGAAGGSATGSSLLQSLAVFASLASAVRGPLILPILALKTFKLSNLQAELNTLIMTTFCPDQITPKRFRKLAKKWSSINTLLMALCCALYMPCFILQMLNVLARKTDEDNTMALLPLYPTVRVPFSSYVVSQFLLVTLPFFMTQMVQIILTVSAVVLRLCCANLNRQIKALSDKIVPEKVITIIVQTEAVINFPADLNDFEKVEGRLEDLIRERKVQYEFVTLVNKHFGFVTCVSYFMDLIAAAGSMGVMMKSTDATTFDFQSRVAGTIAYICFAIIFYLPMVAASETAEYASGIIYATGCDLYSVPRAVKCERVWSMIQDFRHMTVQFPIKFAAEHIFHIDRHFLLTTFTLLMSFAIVLHEFFRDVAAESNNHEREANNNSDASLNFTLGALVNALNLTGLALKPPV